MAHQLKDHQIISYPKTFGKNLNIKQKKNWNAFKSINYICFVRIRYTEVDIDSKISIKVNHAYILSGHHTPESNLAILELEKPIVFNEYDYAVFLPR